MYKIIGADGREYGPITADQLRQWISEGRANAHTKVRPEGSADWKSLAEFLEFHGPLGVSAGTPPPISPPAVVNGATQPTGRGKEDSRGSTGYSARIPRHSQIHPRLYR